jgi:hypothetical protein
MPDAIHGKKAQIRFTTTPSVTFTNEATTADSTRQYYSMSNAAKVYIDDSASVTVQKANDELQSVTITGTPAGGTFVLRFGGQNTSALAYNCTASQMQTALQALSSIGSGNALVTGGPGPGTAFQVQFTSALGQANQASITLQTNSLTGGSSPNVAIAEVQAGQAYTTISNGFTLRYAGGVVVFASVQPVGTYIRMSGKYFPWAAIANGRGHKLKLTRDVKEDTVMTTDANPTVHRTYKPGLAGGEFEATEWFVDATYAALITSETRLYAGLVLDVTTGARMDCACIMKDAAINVALEELEDEPLGFKITGGINFVFP